MTQKEFKSATWEVFRAWVWSLPFTSDSFFKLSELAIQAFSEWKSARLSAHEHGRVNTELRAKNDRLKERYRKAKEERDVLKKQVPLTSKQQLSIQAKYTEIRLHNLRLFSDLIALQAKYEQCCNANKDFANSNEELETDVIDIYSELEQMRAEAKRWEVLSAKNLRLARLQHDRILKLEQQLATYLIPIPGNPGMAFISHPN